MGRPQGSKNKNSEKVLENGKGIFLLPMRKKVYETWKALVGDEDAYQRIESYVTDLMNKEIREAMKTF